MKGALLAAVLVAGCGRASNRPRIDNTVVPPARSAQDWERGVGGPRDYERALEAHLVACDGGAGDLTACDAAIEAIGDSRGATRSIAGVAQVYAGMCKHGDDIGCAWARWFEALGRHGEARMHGREPERQEWTAEDEARDRRIEEACARGEPRACVYQVEHESGWDDGSEKEWELDGLAMVACRGEHVRSCDRIIGYPECGFDVAGCERATVERWRGTGYNDRELEAYQVLDRLCDAGDAMACNKLFARALGDDELCAAKDYEACGNRGCLGDDAAAELARAHGVTDPNCIVAFRRAMVRWAIGTDDTPPPIEPDVVDNLSWKKATAPFEVLVLARAGNRDRLGWPRIELYNIGPKPILAASVCIYIYDLDFHDFTAHQVARLRQDVRGPIAPRGHVPLVLDHPPGTRPLGRAAKAEVMVYDRIHVDGAAPVADPARCPDQRPLSDDGGP